MMTQSVGVPLTAKRRSPTGRSRSGSLSESECDTPDWSYSGATIQTSSESARDLGAGVEALRVDAVVVGDEDAHQFLSFPVCEKSARSAGSDAEKPFTPALSRKID